MGGVGYEVAIPLTVAEKLPSLGSEINLFTYAVYREDSATLYGFLAEGDREFFRTLIEKVSGIGPKTALALLSKAPVERLQAAISSGDVATLSATPGIGKKTAERLLLELKGKLGADLGPQALGARSDSQGDILQALLALGYSDREASAALKALPADIGVSEGIKAALKSLAK